MSKNLRPDVFAFIEKKYGVRPDYPWAKYPQFAVFRHADNNKWFAIYMQVAKNKLGLPGDGMVDVLNLKKDNIVIGGFINQPGILPAYHMNKASWISVILDGSVQMSDIEFLIAVSFDLTQSRHKK